MIPARPDPVPDEDDAKTYIVAFIAAVKSPDAFQALDRARDHALDPKAGAQWTVVEQKPAPAFAATLHVDGASLGTFQFRGAKIDALGKVRPRIVKL